MNAAFGFALGFDQETPGLMERRPMPRGQSVLTPSLLLTVGLVGLTITIGLLSLISIGQNVYGSLAVGQTIAFTSFAFCLIVGAFECRSETESVFNLTTFNSKQMNWAAVAEFVLAVMASQMDAFHRILGTQELNLQQLGWAVVPAVALLGLWELGKLVARRRSR